MKAKQIFKYFLIYREFLRENNLEDDTDKITLKDLIDFVQQQMEPEERKSLYEKVRDL